MIKIFGLERITVRSAAFSIFVVACVLSIGAGWAQDAASEKQAAEATQEKAAAYPAEGSRKS